MINLNKSELGVLKTLMDSQEFDVVEWKIDGINLDELREKLKKWQDFSGMKRRIN